MLQEEENRIKPPKIEPAPPTILFLFMAYLVLELEHTCSFFEVSLHLCFLKCAMHYFGHPKFEVFLLLGPLLFPRLLSIT